MFLLWLTGAKVMPSTVNKNALSSPMMRVSIFSCSGGLFTIPPLNFTFVPTSNWGFMSRTI